MNDKKHVIVGLFVLGGLILFGTLIVWFQGVAGLLRGGYTVRGHLPSSMGVRAGKRVHQDGVEVGEVQDVVSSLPERPGVWVVMHIQPDVEIPREACFIAQSTTIGDMFLDFLITAQPTAYLPKDGSAKVEGTIRPPSLLPEDLMADFRDAMSKIQKIDKVIDNLKELTEPRSLEEVDAGTKPRNLSSALAQFEVTAKSVQTLVEDKETKRLFTRASEVAEELGTAIKEARETLAALRKTAETYTEAGKKAGDLLDKGGQMVEKFSKDADEAQKTIANLNSLVDDLRAGKGTVGQLVSSDELHRKLTTLVENLTTMTENANRLITLWRYEGVIWGKEKK